MFVEQSSSLVRIHIYTERSPVSTVQLQEETVTGDCADDGAGSLHMSHVFGVVRCFGDYKVVLVSSLQPLNV